MTQKQKIEFKVLTKIIEDNTNEYTREINYHGVVLSVLNIIKILKENT